MRWLLFVFMFFVVSCGDNVKSSDPKIAARTKYVQVAATMTEVNDTLSLAVRQGVIKTGSPVALKIDKARAVVRATMDVWGDNPDSVPYMNAALAALPPLLDLVFEFTGKKIASPALAFLEPRSPPCLSPPSCSFSLLAST